MEAEQIARFIFEKEGISFDRIREKSRNGRLIRARKLVALFVYARTPLTQKQISKMYGSGRTCGWYYVNTMLNEYQYNKPIRDLINAYNFELGPMDKSLYETVTNKINDARYHN